MRDFLRDYFDGHLSRRSFFRRLVASGFTVAAARALVETADLGELEVAPDAPGRAYQQTGIGADLLLEQVKAAGTKFIFTNPGSLEAPFFDALTDRPDLQLILGLHEGIVISMADGYHKVTKQPAFVNVHAVVGTAQMAGQLCNAQRDGSALVVTAGMNDTTIFSDDLGLAPRAGFNQSDINKQFTKISWEVRSAASTGVAIRRAYKLAGTAPGGPVYVAFSTDSLRAAGITGDVWPRENFMVPVRPRPPLDQVEALARMLLEATLPLPRFGDEVWKSDAQAEAVQLCELLGIPAVNAGGAFTSFPTSHPQLLPRAASGIYPDRTPDLVIQIGARDPGGSSVPEPRAEAGPRYVAIGLDANALGRTQALDLAIVADTKETLKALIDAVRSLATRDRLNRIRRDRLAWLLPPIAQMTTARLEAARASFDQQPIHPDRLDYELGKALDRHAIVLEENFTQSHDFFPFGYRPNEMMRLTKAGSLGWGIGAAIGAKIGAPDRQVVLSIGDGAVMYSAAGFWTMARYEVPVLTVIANNQNYQMVRNAYFRYQQRIVQTGHYHGTYLGDPAIDFVKLAESQGVKGARVTSPTELEAGLAQGLRAVRDGQPFVLDVQVSRVGGGAESTWHQKYSVAAQRPVSSA